MGEKREREAGPEGRKFRRSDVSLAHVGEEAGFSNFAGAPEPRTGPARSSSLRLGLWKPPLR
jgi:hypothetical protein